MNGRRQHNVTKVIKADCSKKRQKKDIFAKDMFTAMDHYLGLEEIKNIIHNTEEEVTITTRNGCVRSSDIKKEPLLLEELDEVVIVSDCQEQDVRVSCEDTSPLPNVRLSPRKHASTLSRCANTSKENVKTPHRIRLCEAEPKILQSHTFTLNPYNKRTRRRLNAALDDAVAQVETINNTSNNKTKSYPKAVVKQEVEDVKDNTISNHINNHTNGMFPQYNEETKIDSKCSSDKNVSALHNHSTDRDVKPVIVGNVNGILKKNGFVDTSVTNNLDSKTLTKLECNRLVNGMNGKCMNVINGKTKPTLTNGHIAASNGNRKLTEFFPVRRSVRKTKKEVLEEKHRAIELAILEEKEEGLEVAVFEGKGRGIVAARAFRRGEFVVEYAGELVSMQEAKEREARYALDSNKGCYMYYFKHNNQQYCIDATAESGRLGRLVNHSRNGNLVTKPVFLHHRPHLVLLAGQDISPGEEVTYDYGDRSKESLLAHPWLAF